VTYSLAAKGEDIKVEDPVGAWKLKCVSPDGKPRECVVTVFRVGMTLKAKHMVDGAEKPAKDVSFQQGILSFCIDGKFAGQTYELTYKGKPRGRDLQGQVRWSYGWATGSFAFEGERIARKVAANS
jgi:hypothetical protein